MTSCMATDVPIGKNNRIPDYDPTNTEELSFMSTSEVAKRNSTLNSTGKPATIGKLTSSLEHVG